MSNVYNLEPPTRGKVVLHTSLGDLDIELWPKEAPKAVRNFVQLCMEGYYNGTLFHRVIKDYMVQGGDPTGTGTGGDSIYGDLFKDEFHQRLKFNHRGLVACANQNQPHTNGSQFFISLDKCDWLDRKNTIFGKVVGDTIYNLARFNEVDTDPETDRPFEPPRISSCEVLDNPFPDIVPRRLPAAVQQQLDEEKSRQERAKAAGKPGSKAAGGGKAAKNLALLSFEEDGGEEDGAVQLPAKRIRAAHDVLSDARLVREEDIPAEERIRVDVRPKGQQNDNRIKQEQGDAEQGEGDAADHAFAERMRARVRDKQHALAAKDGKGTAMQDNRHLDEDDESELRGAARRRSTSAMSGDEEYDREEEEGRGRGRGREKGKEQQGSGAVVRRQEELDAYKKDRRALGKLQSAGIEVEDADLLKPWQAAVEKYKKRKQVIGRREKDTLQRLSQFTAKLKASAHQAAPQGGEQEDQESQPAASEAKASQGYNGKVDDYLDGDFEDTSIDNLSTHKLQFSTAPKTEAERRRDDADDYVVFDPLLEAAKGKFSKAAQKEKKRKNEWAGKSNV